MYFNTYGYMSICIKRKNLGMGICVWASFSTPEFNYKDNDLLTLMSFSVSTHVRYTFKMSHSLIASNNCVLFSAGFGLPDF